MRHLALTLFALCLLMPAPCLAAEADRAKTMELIEILDIGSVIDMQMEMLAPAMANMMKGGHSKLPDRAVDIIFEEVKTLVSSVKPRILDGYAAIYENNFTPEEIGQLVEIYQTPVLRKLTDVQLELMQQGSVMVDAVLHEELGPYMQRLEQRFAEEFPDGFPEDQ